MNWKVFRRSENTNNFGLKEFYFMSEEGNCYRALGNYLRERDFRIGKVFSDRGSIADELIRQGFECGDEVKALYKGKIKVTEEIGKKIYKQLKPEPVFKQAELAFESTN